MTQQKPLLMLAAAGLIVFGSAAQGAIISHRYSFDGNANDSVGNADLTLNGSAAISGSVLDLPGGTTRTNNASATGGSLTELASTINSSSAITIEAWFNQDAQTGWAKIFMAGNSTGEYEYLDITPYRGNTTQLGITINDSSHDEAVLGSQTLGTDTEHYVAAIWDTTTGYMSITVGQVGGTLTTYTATMGGNTLADIPINEFYLGSAVGFGDPDFNGQIDELRIWKGVLTGDEITRNFEAGPNSIVPEPSTVMGMSSLLASMGIGAAWRRIRVARRRHKG